jgi:hypothetical protein
VHAACNNILDLYLKAEQRKYRSCMPEQLERSRNAKNLYLIVIKGKVEIMCKNGFLNFVHRLYYNKVHLITWEGLTDGLGAHLNTFMSYLPQTMVFGRRLLLRAHLC